MRLLAALVPIAIAGWCDDEGKRTGYHCRRHSNRVTSQYCSCHTETKWKTDEKTGQQKLKTKYECDKVGDEVECENGCSGGRCVPDTEVCGDSWATGAISPIAQSCPNTDHKTWKNIMESSSMVTNLMGTVESDVDWFEGLMSIDLLGPYLNSTMVTTHPTTGVATVTLPASLQAIATEHTPAYRSFSCARNLPECVNNMAATTECEQKCTSISNAIGAFSAECMRLKQEYTNNGTSMNATCHTLATLSVDDGGCAEPWCSNKGEGGGVLGQGWERNCKYLCTEQSPGGGVSSATVTGALAALSLGLASALV